MRTADVFICDLQELTPRAGVLVSGASPVYAGSFQFIVVAMILAASGIAGLTATVLMRGRAFSAAAQLTLRASTPGK